VKRQRGFTLVELLIAAALTGLLAVVLGPAVSQIFSVSRYGNDVLDTTHGFQNAAHWFLSDGRRAVSANVSDGLVFSFGATATASYRLNGSELERTAATGVTVLAGDIATATFTREGRLVTMTLTTAPAGSVPAYAASYTVSLRADG
jgi:prepilin-type N-terminal cleavage/methylation domain-containing protein